MNSKYTPTLITSTLGFLSQKDACEIYKKISENFQEEKIVKKSYEIMKREKCDEFDIAKISGELDLFTDGIAHPIGELVFTKGRGLAVRIYDGDFGWPSLINTTPNHFKIFGLKYEDILYKIKEWNKKDYFLKKSQLFSGLFP